MDIALGLYGICTVILLVESYLVIKQDQVLALEVILDLLLTLAVSGPICAHDKLDVELSGFLRLEISVNVHAITVSTEIFLLMAYECALTTFSYWHKGRLVLAGMTAQAEFFGGADMRVDRFCLSLDSLFTVIRPFVYVEDQLSIAVIQDPLSFVVIRSESCCNVEAILVAKNVIWRVVHLIHRESHIYVLLFN